MSHGSPRYEFASDKMPTVELLDKNYRGLSLADLVHEPLQFQVDGSSQDLKWDHFEGVVLGFQSNLRLHVGNLDFLKLPIATQLERAVS